MKILYKPHEYSQQRQKDKPAHIYPVHLAMEATYNLINTQDKIFWDCDVDADKIITEPEGIDFLKLPIPARIFTKAKSKKYQKYGNYKYHPATHMMSALDCWYAKCTFCDWAKKYPEVKTRQVDVMVDEVMHCHRLGFKEIFDDSGTFPIGGWLYDFCDTIKKIDNTPMLGCNMRIVNTVDFYEMAQAGFRMVLFGVESFNQRTLDKLNKGIRSEDIIPCIKKAALCGLEPHIAFMTGYPWETFAEEMNTIKKVTSLLKAGYAKTAQVSTFNVPNIPSADKGLKHEIYNVAYSPTFWINKIKDIKNYADFLYLLKSIRKGLVHD